MTWSATDVGDLAGRRALVTGATSGVGEATVLELARHGAEVVMAARNETKLAATMRSVEHQVPGVVVRPLLVDLADLGSVRRAAAQAGVFGPLHLLVNNAGVMATPYQRTADGFELQLGTNHLGHFALTGLLMPQLVASGGARVVTVPSLAHRMARRAPLEDPRVPPPGRYRRWQAYASSKLANLLFTFELDGRAREAGLPLTALAAHPGLARTNLVAGGRVDDSSLRGRILDAAVAVTGQSAARGALPILMAATADLAGASYVGPGGFAEAHGAPVLVGSSGLARDPDAARRLWEVSEAATGVVFP